MKALLVLATFVAGFVAGFAVHSFGWDESNPKVQNGSGKAFTDETGTHYVYTLRDGDIVMRPDAGARCAASGEAGTPNLFCTRIGGGRHQIIFYKDDVLVWPLDCPACGPDGPVYTYHWAEKLSSK
jgi:hypothetical protein